MIMVDYALFNPLQSKYLYFITIVEIKILPLS